MKCPYCGYEAKLVDSKEIYGKSYGKAWVCSFYPGCDSYVGCHPGTEKPLGTMADKKLRKLRNECHLLFDSIWKSGKKDRSSAYAMLRHTLKISEENCHIAMFDVATCKSLIRIFDADEKLVFSFLTGRR